MMKKDLKKPDFETLCTMHFEERFGKFLDDDGTFEGVNAAVFDLVRKAYIAGCKYSYDILTNEKNDGQ